MTDGNFVQLIQKGGIMKKVIQLLTLIFGFQAIILSSQSNSDSDTTAETIDTTTQSDQKSKDDTQDVVIQKSKDTKNIKPKVETKKVTPKAVPSKTTLFVNGRINSILLVITNDKNQQFKITIRGGSQYECHHAAQSLKKIVCYEMLTPNTTLSQSDLNTYLAFVFNTDQKLEKYHFINIKQKHAALKRANALKNETLFHEISEQNIYYP